MANLIIPGCGAPLEKQYQVIRRNKFSHQSWRNSNWAWEKGSGEEHPLFFTWPAGRRDPGRGKVTSPRVMIHQPPRLPLTALYTAAHHCTAHNRFMVPQPPIVFTLEDTLEIQFKNVIA